MYQVPTANRLLLSISSSARARLAPHFERLVLERGQVIYEPETPIAYAYFPETALISVVALTREGAEVEVSMTGREGVFGAELTLGTDSIPMRAMCQGRGEALRLPARVVLGDIDSGGELIPAMRAYTGVSMVEMAQSAACNRLHTVDFRLARWLLTVRDRLETDTLPITHEFMAVMLGVHRPRLTVAAGLLQAAGLIRYRRGRVSILDPIGLAEAACECYAIVKRAYDRFERSRGVTSASEPATTLMLASEG